VGNYVGSKVAPKVGYTCCMSETTKRADTFRVRFPRKMQEQLHQLAEQEGVTLNMMVVTLLTDAMGLNYRPKQDEADDE
jgi:Arc-like DNA binding domain